MLLFDDSKKLEKTLGEEAASVIAHVFEQADAKWRSELATKADLQEGLLRLEMQMDKRIAEVRVEIAAVRVEMQAMGNQMAAMENRIIKWMIGSLVAFGAFLLAAMAFLK